MEKPELSPPELHRAMQCAARCDAIISTKDWLRTFRYEPNWRDGVSMAKYDNGAGDHVFVFFTDEGHVIMKGFDHESDVSPHARDVYAIWPGIYDGVPPNLLQIIEDESVEHEDVTFCCWSIDGKSWESGSAVFPEDVDDGSGWLLPMTQMNAGEFIAWGRSYYEGEFERIGEDGVELEFRAARLPPDLH
jgi:hypothetical protein